MKITREKSKFKETQLQKSLLNSSPKSDLSFKPNLPRKPPRRKTKTSGIGVRLKKESRAPKRSSRPETPLVGWKYDEKNGNSDSIKKEKSSAEVGWNGARRIRAVVSARKLGAALWRIHSPEFQYTVGGNLGFQFRNGHFAGSIHDHHHHHINKIHSSSANDLVYRRYPVSGRKNGLLHNVEPSFQGYDSIEGVTKWDPVGRKLPDEFKQVFGQPVLTQETNTSPVISALEVELEQARSRINELETERRSSKKKVEQFLRKLSEERATWRSREHEKIRSVIKDVKIELTREKKNRQRLEMINFKLVNDLADVRLSTKRYVQECEKERKSRELIEEVCDELARELGEDKADREAFKQESMKLQEEIEEDRKMLQMAEVWREERVQMKLVDAKNMLEEKYSQMNKLVMDLETFVNSGRGSLDMEEMKAAEFLLQAALSVDIHDVRELTYEPPNPDDLFNALEELNFGTPVEKEVVDRVGPRVNGPWRHSNACFDQSGGVDEDGSEWETVSHLEDQGSSYSPDRSDIRGDNSDVSEVCSVPRRSRKKVPSISRLWRSNPSNGDSYKIIAVEGKNGFSNNGALLSEHGSAEVGMTPRDSSGQWSSPELGQSNVMHGMKGGCIEWPRNGQKSSLKAKLLAARMEGQKIQLKHVLKQKY